MRRSTIHVDDRVFCDKAVLRSIYGHAPGHASKRSSCDQNSDQASLRPLQHRNSVPNLAEEADVEALASTTAPVCADTARLRPVCADTARLRREIHRSSATHVPLHNKYIRAYTRFYERKLAVKLLDLNKVIREEKQNSDLLDERIKQSLIENEKLLLALNAAKMDIVELIIDIETPV